MNRKILLQVTAPALLTGLLLVGTCLIGAWSIHRLQSNLASILSENVASLQAASALENQMRQLRYHSLYYLLHPNKAWLTQIETDERLFQEALERAREAARGPEQHKYLKEIETGYVQYHEEMARLRQDVEREGPRGTFDELAKTHPIRHIVTPCQKLGEISRAKVEQTSLESDELSRKARLVLLLLGLGGPIGGLLCGYGIVRGLSRSITQLSVRVRDVVDRLERPDSCQEIDLGSVTVAAEGDLGALDRQLQHVLRRVEEVTERLQRQHRDMLRAEQLAAVGQLAAGVAHEIRNPLTGMKLLVEAALRPRNAQPLSEEDVRVIHGEITRLEESVQNFLRFARPPALVRQECDLRDAVARPVELVRARARQLGVEIDVQLPPEPVPVSLDVSQFNTVVVNLLLNALDAMGGVGAPRRGPGGGRLDVRVEPAKADNGDPNLARCRLRICDTGPGIAPAVAGRLFTPFASTKPTGTGLGLSLSRRIVEEHGGRITGGNRPEGEGPGACFAIELPVLVSGSTMKHAG
jgi:signal transduction histidine kinase